MSDYTKNNMLNDEEDTQKDKYLTFSIGEDSFGIEIEHVVEIIKLQTITEVPDVEDYVKGVINLRGKIIPVMDIRLRFNKEPRNYHDRTCVIVIDVNDITVGIIVDKVADVVIIPEESVAKPPDINKTDKKYIKSIGKTGDTVKLILDCEELIKRD